MILASVYSVDAHKHVSIPPHWAVEPAGLIDCFQVKVFFEDLLTALAQSDRLACTPRSSVVWGRIERVYVCEESFTVPLDLCVAEALDNFFDEVRPLLPLLPF